MLGLLLAGRAVGAEPARYARSDSVAVDLDGDGRPEMIRLENSGGWSGVYGGSERFTLRVGEERCSDSLSYEVTGFQVLDIDVGDHRREVSVYTEGPSDDEETILYTYRARRLHRLGRLTSLLDFPGDGRILVHYLCGFWFRTELYQCDLGRERVEWVPQEFYPVDAFVPDSLTARGTLPLRRSPTDSTRLGTIRPGERFEFVLWCPPAHATERERIGGDDGWYLVTDSHRLSGWLPGSAVNEMDGLLYPD